MRNSRLLPPPAHEVTRTARSCLSIIERYRIGEESAHHTIKTLKSKELVGAYFAGELALQVAIDAPQEHAGDWLAIAERQFKGENYKGYTRDGSPYLSFGAKAAIRRAQMPLQTCVLLKRRLPSPESAQRAYMQTLERAKALIQVLRTSNEVARRKEVTEVIGLLGEVSVLLLGQRAAQEIGTKEWFPLQSSLFEDHANRYSGCPWDINLFTHAGIDEPIERPYRIQVKSKSTPHESDAPEISRINIDPDLMIPKDNHHRLALGIIEECHMEATDSDVAAQRITPILNRRTAQLLDKLDQ